MRHMRRTLGLPILLALVAVPVMGCQAPDEDVAAATGDTMSVALPNLFSIMAGLESDMAKLSRGLWAESFDTVAAGAGAVADHPKIPPAEGRKIAEILGEDMSRFQELDGEVHDLAQRIRTLAHRGDLQGILSAEARLRDGCVTCHSEFRTRLRSGVTTDDGGGS